MAEKSSIPPRKSSILWLARLGWLLVVGLVMSLYVANLPYLTLEARYEWQIGEAWPFARQIFARHATFASWLVFWRVCVGMTFFGTGLLLAWRKWSSWIVLLISADLLLLSALYTLSFNIDRIRFPALLTRLIPNLNGFTMLLLASAMLSLFYLFPDGRFALRRWRWLAWLAVANALAWTALFAFPGINRSLETRWPALRGEDELGWTLFVGSLLAAMLVGFAGQVVRYRHIASAEERQQTKWVIIGLLGLVAVPLGTTLFFDIFNIEQTPLAHFIFLHLELLGVSLIPLTIAFSVLRYRLWEVDLWLSRTLVYGSLTVLVVLTYVLLVGGLGELLRGESVWLAVTTTGLVALAIHPLRAWLQRSVNRLLYGQRDEPAQMLARLGEQLATTSSIDQMLPNLVQTVASALKLPYAAIQLVQGSGATIAAQYGQSTGSECTFPISYQGIELGQLLAAPRAPDEALTARDIRLLKEMAQQAGPAVHAIQLTADLQRSREQLVTAREEERRRLRRDLHDGLGPQLATLSLKIDAARNALYSAPQQADQLLVDYQTQTQAALVDLRRIVYDLRPPALDQLGLLSAIEQQLAICGADSSIEFTFDAPETLPPLPAAVEVAAYRIVVEAATNVMRHAEARHCTVRLALDNEFAIAITDDGIGVQNGQPNGVGILSMRERAAELGGRCEISGNGEGTVVNVWLPIET